MYTPVMKEFLSLALGAALGYGLLSLLERKKNPYRRGYSQGADEPALTEDFYDFGQVVLDRSGPRKFKATKLFLYGYQEVPAFAGEVVDEGTHLVVFHSSGKQRTYDVRDLNEAASWLSKGVPRPSYTKAALYTGSFSLPLAGARG